MKRQLFIFILITIVSTLNSVALEQRTVTPADPDYYAMDRENIHFDEYLVLLVNYRGFVLPRQYSVTQFTNVQFLPIQAERYNFNLNFFEKATGRLIEDDVPIKWKSWIDDSKSYDSLGSNFSPNSPSIMVTQDEKWKQNSYFRSATFYKEYNSIWVSFSAKSWTNVSYDDDEVFIKHVLTNRNTKNMEMIIIPNQIAEDIACHFKEGTTKVETTNVFTIGSPLAHICVSASIKKTSDKGFEMDSAPGKTETYYFGLKFYQPGNGAPEISQSDIQQRMQKADQKNCEMLAWAYKQLPKFSRTNKKFEYYYRCLLSVPINRYENRNYISDVFWGVGTCPYTISWDNSNASGVIAMLDPESLKQAILKDFKHVQMKRTYVGWNGAFWDNLYIQEPFALQIMIEAYMRHSCELVTINN